MVTSQQVISQLVTQSHLLSKQHRYRNNRNPPFVFFYNDLIAIR